MDYIDIDERIDSFLKGMMSSEEEQLFKEDVQKDADLRQRTSERLLLLKGIRQYGKERDEKVIEDTKSSSRSKSKKIFYMRNVVSMLSVAACLVIVVLICQRYLGSDPAMDYAMSESSAMLQNMNKSLRGGDNEAVEKELIPIFNAVLEDKDIKADITKLEKLYAIATDEYVDDIDEYGQEIGFLLATAYIKDNNNAKAASTLRSLLKKYPDCQEAEIVLQKLQ